MKQYIITGLLLLLSVLGFSQGEWNKWCFGKYITLDFNSGNPVKISNNAMWAGDGTISISDSLGNLLFYSDGSKVWDRNNNIMPNGSGLHGIWSTERACFAVSSLANDSTYYLFTVGNDGTGAYWGLEYSLIDMKLNGGFGDIVPSTKNIQVHAADSCYNYLYGIRHHNNRDIWIITKQRPGYPGTQYKYMAFLLTQNGLDTIPVISNTSLINNGAWPGILKVSPDGSKFFACSLPGGGPYAEFYNYNDQTGIISPRFKFAVDDNGLNPSIYAEFSPDNHFLYVVSGTTNSPHRLYQFDASMADSLQFQQSQVFLGTGCYSMQAAPDGKIYINARKVTPPYTFIDSMHVINNPNFSGAMCDFQKNIIGLNGQTGGNTSIPWFLQKYNNYILSDNICFGDSLHFHSVIWPPPDTIRWNFGDPASGGANISFLLNPSHLYLGPGTYTVELYVRHNDKRTDTTWRYVTIYTNPAPSLGPDESLCNGSSATFDAGFCSGCTYEWKNVGTGLVVGTNQTFTTGTAGNYCVKVTNGNGCSGYDTIQLVTTPVPQVTNNQLIKSICSGESTNIPLTSNVPGAMFHWTASLTSGNITGFSADSGLVINQNLIDNLPTLGSVKYTVTPKVGNCSGTPVDFVVTVNPVDSAKVSITASSNNVCSGTQVTFIATPINPGTTPVYQWKVNGMNAGSNSPLFSYAPANGDQVQCILTSSLTVCISNNPASSNIISMVVNPKLPVSVSVTPSANPVCAGTLVTFTATPTYGGTNPSYQWKVNGGNVGTDNPVYTYVPANGDLVWCILTSSEVCTSNNPASSIQHQMVVNPLLTVSVTISASSNPFCIGNSVTFTATHTNGGSSPSYQWKVNGTNVSIDTLYTYYPVNGDMVSCVFTSSASCVTGNPATSNTITMIGTLGLPAGVSINAIPYPFCPGSSVTCTATPGNGGTNPVYQWKVNGVNVGINSPTYTFNPLNNDSIRCVMTSNLSCVSGNPATSNKIILSGTLAPIVTFTRCFDSVTTLNAKPIKLKGGIPLGGTYSGPGVNSVTGVFTPLSAGIGTKIITYSYTNVALCSASKTKSIIVQSNPAFTCGNNLTDIRDNKVYPTLQLGSQCWMASNLNYGTMISASLHQRDNCITEKYCYNDLTGNCELGTANYQWDELMLYSETPGQQGLCPPAWHVPTEAEWNTLFANWNNNAFAGAPLKYSGYSGFNALLSGVRHMNVQWDYQDEATFFWSSTPYGTLKAWAHGINNYDPSVAAYPASKANGFSVRCLKDN
jgi:uncharacterized protein (TIGR02145 family)